MKLIKHINSWNILSLALICTLAMSSALVSCEEKEEAMNEIILHSFGPSGVHHGDTIKFIGLNLDQVSAIVLQPGIEVTDFITKTSTLLEIKIPKAAEAGLVTLKTTKGDIVSKSPLSFEVPVTVTSMTSEVRPGGTLTITGDLLNWVKGITFKDGLVVEEFESQSLTELKVTVPMEAQTGFLIFSSGGTDPLTFASEEELIVTLPTVTALNPASIRHTENLKIEGADLDLVTSVIFSNDTVAEFASQSATEIVVAVPATTVKGTLTLTQVSPVKVTTSQELTIILPAGSSVEPSPAIPGVDNITIVGTDLDLVGQLKLPAVSAIASTEFVSHSDTEIIVGVPAGTESGGISYTTIHGFSGNLGANIIVPGEGPPPLAITMYDDEIFYGGGDWSWGVAASDQASTEQFYSGSVSWKHTTDGSDGGASVGGMSGIDASGQGVFAFSLYGGPGTDGIQVACILGSDGADKWDSYNSVTLVEGEWTEYQIELSNYATVNLSNVTRWIFKPEGSTGATIYVDRVGFDPGGPAPLAITMFDEEIAYNGGNWSWGTAESDPENTEQAYSGSISWKHTTDGDDGGASVGGMDPIDASGMSVFTFSLYGGPGTDGVSVACILGDDTGDVWGNYNAVTLAEGKWTEYQIDLSNYGDVNLSSVQRWIFKPEGTTDATIYVDRVGFD